MPERVRRYRKLDAGFLAQATHQGLNSTRGDRPTRLTGPVATAEGRVCSATTATVTAGLPIREESLCCLAVEVDRAALASLGAVDARCSCFQIDVLLAERAEFRHTDSGSEQEQDQRADLEATELACRVRLRWEAPHVFDDPFQFLRTDIGWRSNETR